MRTGRIRPRIPGRTSIAESIAEPFWLEESARQVCVRGGNEFASTTYDDESVRDAGRRSRHSTSIFYEAWIGLGKVDREVTEYGRALEFDDDILANNAQVGVWAQIRIPEQQARFAFLIAKAYAKRGNVDGALDYLQRAKDLHYSELADMYKDK